MLANSSLTGFSNLLLSDQCNSSFTDSLFRLVSSSGVPYTNSLLNSWVTNIVLSIYGCG